MFGRIGSNRKLFITSTRIQISYHSVTFYSLPYISERSDAPGSLVLFLLMGPVTYTFELHDPHLAIINYEFLLN